MNLTDVVALFTHDLEDAMATNRRVRVVDVETNHAWVDGNQHVHVRVALSDGTALRYGVVLPASTHRTPELLLYVERMFMARACVCMEQRACVP